MVGSSVYRGLGRAEGCPKLRPAEVRSRVSQASAELSPRKETGSNLDAGDRTHELRRHEAASSGSLQLPRTATEPSQALGAP